MKSVSIFSIPQGLSEQERMARRRMVARLGLAWLGMMQIMMFAAPGYFRHNYLDSPSLQTLDEVIIILNWVSFALSMPVVLYCAAPIWQGFFTGAGHSHHRINMNWPVGIGIIISFVPSVVTTVTHHGEVYFDSISMFVAFLLTARYLEFCAAQSSQMVQADQALSRLEAQRELDLAKADKIAFYFVSAQIVLALATGFVWYRYIQADHALAVMVSLFVMSCPCAMAMSVPTCYAVGRTLYLNFDHLDESQHQLILKTVNHAAHLTLYTSLVWHFLMSLLAIFGLVSPWVAALTMFVSSVWVAWYAWYTYKRLAKRFKILESQRLGLL